MESSSQWEEVEALDIDDSDLRSLAALGPCKHQRLNTPTTTNLPQSQTLAPSQPQLQSQTLISLSQNPNSSHNHPEPKQSQLQLPLPLSTVCVIPGPAGIIQQAKIIRNGVDQEDQIMATQKYIRKAVEDPNEVGDFKGRAWLSAVEFLSSDGMFGSVPSARLGEIKKYCKSGKLNQVVAVINSSTPNALGDLTVTLKDPTGTIFGTIHHKVLTEGEFGKGICVGCVLILHKVSVFSPSRSAHYLNITKRNLVKVFYKDGGSSQKQTLIIKAARGFDSGRGTQMSGRAFSLEPGAEGTSNGVRRSTTNKQSLYIDNEPDNSNSVASVGPQCSMTSNEGTNQKIVTDEEMLVEADVIQSRENVTRVIEGTKNGLPTVSASLPIWTDEQLNELDGDFDF